MRPALLLSTCPAVRSRVCWLEIRPPWLFNAPLAARFRCWPAVSVPAWLSRLATWALSVPWLDSSPALLSRWPTLASMAPSALIRPPWPLCRRAACRSLWPALSSRPPPRLSSVSALAVSWRWALRVPPWLSRVWPALTCRSRLATTLLPRLSRCCARNCTSPAALRLLSRFTPASMTPWLFRRPPLSRLMRPAAARLWRLSRSPWVLTRSSLPAYTAPWASSWPAVIFTAPFSALASARRSWPLASSWISPPLAINWPSSLTPTPASVPTSLMVPAYMPPRAEESIASCGASAGLAARAVALRLWASTSLAPATTASCRAWSWALILALRVMISNWSTLLALSPAPSMATLPCSTW